MSEYSEVEQPFLQQLESLGWDSIDQGQCKNFGAGLQSCKPSVWKKWDQTRLSDQVGRVRFYRARREEEQTREHRNPVGLSEGIDPEPAAAIQRAVLRASGPVCREDARAALPTLEKPGQGA